MTQKRLLALFAIIFLLYGVITWNIGNARALVSKPAPTPTLTEASGMIAFPDMMVAPVLPENPSQADYGRQVYYYVCMACHGNLGQGLTQEWVAEWGEGNSCWQSKCHASNHPEEGFKLPLSIPGVVGDVVLKRFNSALELHDFLQQYMPWQAPSSLTDEEYWQLTAYLLVLNGISPGNEPLDAVRAAEIKLGEDAPVQPAKDGLAPAAVLAIAAGGLILFAVLFILLWRWKRTRSGNPGG